MSVNTSRLADMVMSAICKLDFIPSCALSTQQLNKHFACCVLGTFPA